MVKGYILLNNTQATVPHAAPSSLYHCFSSVFAALFTLTCKKLLRRGYSILSGLFVGSKEEFEAKQTTKSLLGNLFQVRHAEFSVN